MDQFKTFQDLNDQFKTKENKYKEPNIQFNH